MRLVPALVRGLGDGDDGRMWPLPREIDLPGELSAVLHRDRDIMDLEREERFGSPRLRHCREQSDEGKSNLVDGSRCSHC